MTSFPKRVQHVLKDYTVVQFCSVFKITQARLSAVLGEVDIKITQTFVDRVDDAYFEKLRKERKVKKAAIIKNYDTVAMREFKTTEHNNLGWVRS